MLLELGNIIFFCWIYLIIKVLILNGNMQSWKRLICKFFATNSNFNKNCPTEKNFFLLLIFSIIILKFFFINPLWPSSCISELQFNVKRIIPVSNYYFLYPTKGNLVIAKFIRNTKVGKTNVIFLYFSILIVNIFQERILSLKSRQ